MLATAAKLYLQNYKTHYIHFNIDLGYLSLCRRLGNSCPRSQRQVWSDCRRSLQS